MFGRKQYTAGKKQGPFLVTAANAEALKLKDALVAGKFAEFDVYQKAIRPQATYPTLGHPLVYPALELADEAGEVAGKVKKLMRDHNGQMTEELRIGIAKEMGDVLWALTQLASELGLPLSYVAAVNYLKVADRHERGVVGGDGDDR